MKGPLRVGSFLLFLVMLPGDAHAERESWYTYWGLGWSHIEYPGDSDNNLRDLPGVDSISVSVDTLGFYFPVNEHSNLLVGFIANGATERFVLSSSFSNSGQSEWIEISLLQVGFSMLNFFGNEPGDGFFLRGDLGIAQSAIGTSSKIGVNEKSEFGMGAILGFGYGVPVSAGTRILFNFNYSYKAIEDENYKITQVSVGGLF